MSIFDIDSIAFTVAGYSLSYVELIGTVFGLLSVYLAGRLSIWTWSTGIVNEFFLFCLFAQIHLYADMLLQIYFFFVTIYGWYFWKKKEHEKSVTRLKPRMRITIILILIAGTIISGYVVSNLHLYLPDYFPSPASFPYADSFVMVGSIVATILLARKNIETWVIWIGINSCCIVIYFQKGVYFLAWEYVLFFFLAIHALIKWRKNLADE